MLAGQRGRPRPSAYAHRFRFGFDSRVLLGRVKAATKMVGSRPRRFQSWRVRGWGSKKRNPFSAHQSLTLRELARRGMGSGFRRSPPQPELGDDRPVALDVLALQVIQQPATLADQLEQPPPRVVILGVRLQVVGEVIDPFAEDCDLDLR